ncbi:vicilin-like antimicrobial peptides 2-3 [Papaver somniferum]|uniref:vicilin-like antimicrobial peptides 2-3 n=1 Tax=Papaver somniferum TaxID=3469 RepID=UPI000E70126B|nr:vicilin-like antimicrobial peptides 2-3 [Papaver somniferum]
MAFKAKFSLLVFLLSFFLFSAASCLGQRDPQQELEQCRQLCARQQRFRQQQCEQQCQERFEERQREQGRDENTRDPQQEYLQCQRTCQQQERSQQQQCQQRCEQRRREQEREQQRDEQDPQREYQQCQPRCQQQPGQQQQCEQRCEERRRQQERELQRHEQSPQREYQQCQRRCQQQQQCEQRCQERRRQQEKEQQRDEQSPQREYQQCQRRCQQQQAGQQQQCEQRCEETRRQQEREQQRDEQSSRREYQQCQRRCQQQQPGQPQQCEQRCEERRRQQEREQQRDEQSPQREYQQCQRRCQQQQPGQAQHQCEQRCEERRRQQEREQQREQSPQKEYQQCQRRCQQQQPGQQQQCEQRCEERRRQQEREQQRDDQDPQREYQQCQRRCQQQPGQQQQCEQRCEERRRQQEREQQRDDQSPQREYQQCQRRCQQQQPGQQQQQCEERCEERRRQQEKGQRDVRHGNNPYFYDEQSFIDRYSTQEGYIRILPKFTEQSNLLGGIENYRLAIFQANPNTFVIPSHWDADAVLFVVKGRGTISLVRQQNRESYNLKQGDVLRVPVGSLVYMINRDNSETLQIGKILVTVSTPGQVREFFSSGDHEPESFYRVFSNDILESAFNTPRERLDRLFGQQTQGVIIRASQEQVRELGRHASSSSEEGHFWPKRGGQSSSGPFNILNKRATYSNNYGQLYEVDGNEYKQLQDLDLGVSFTNISQGGMLGPYYNTRSTKVLLVVEGNGRFEMACPHLSKQSQRQQRGRQEFEEEREQGQGVHYEKVSARLSPRSVFIVPAGHPVAIVASQNQNLQIVAFEINAQGNQRNFLAGRESVINQMEKVAMELGFNVPSSEVQEILNKQRESFFLPGPNQRQQQRGSHGLSILDFVGF